VIYQSTKLYTGYWAIYHDMVINTGCQIGRHTE